MDFAKSTPSDIAVHYAERGWKVIPVLANGKEPAIDHWPDKATDDPERLRLWFDTLSTFESRPNIGLVTGAASGFFVVDIDTKSDADAFLHAAELLGHDDLIDPDTIQVDTPSGGQHWYFKVNGETIRNHTGIASGVDIKGDRGYVLAPGSIIDGKPYSFGRYGDISDPPPALVERLKQPPRVQRSDLKWDDTKGVAKGGRNNALTILAGKLWNCGLEPGELYAALTERNRTYKPPLSEDQLRCIVRSAERNFERSKPTPQSSGGWPLRRLDLIKTMQLPEREPIIGPFLSAATTVLAALRGSGKTFFATEIAQAVASGGGFCDWPTQQQGKVAFVQLDMTIHAVKKRATGRDWHPDFHYVTRYDFQRAGLAIPNLGDPAHWEWISEALEPYLMVIFDTRRTVQPPGQGAAANLWHPSYWLASQPIRQRLVDEGKAVVFLDHLTPDGEIKDTKSIADDVDTVIALKDSDKGTSDLCFHLELPKDRDKIDAEDSYFEFDGKTWQQFTDTSIKTQVLQYRESDHTVAETAAHFGIGERTVKKYAREARASRRQWQQGQLDTG